MALVAGLIIFPACFAFAVEPGSGPGLVFVTLPSVFNQMPLGQLWGALFFVFMSFAALSTIIAVFENLISWSMDKWNWTRKTAVARTAIIVTVLSLPCALGFNVLAGVQVPAIGDIQSIEDFIVSNNLLPLGSLFYVLFCVTKGGWGWDNFHHHIRHGLRAEVRHVAGDGVGFAKALAGEGSGKGFARSVRACSASWLRATSPLRFELQYVPS